MKILLYNPDNGVTRNFMPHLWMFLLKALTPPEHEVLLIDGNAQALDEEGLARFVREQEIGLVGIGAMTRMVAKAYRMADAVRAAGVPVVMGGPHVTEAPDEALGRDGGPESRRRSRARRSRRDLAANRRGCGAGTTQRDLCAGGRGGQGTQAELCNPIRQSLGNQWTSINSTSSPTSWRRCLSA